MLSNCTIAFDSSNNKWHKVNDHKLGPGGELIKGTNKLYYMGGIDINTGKKSKAIYEYEGKYGWKKWKQELPVPKDMRNSWSMMEIGSKFCNGSKNMTHTLDGFDAWHFKSIESFKFFNVFEHVHICTKPYIHTSFACPHDDNK